MDSVRYYNKSTHQSGLKILFGSQAKLWSYDKDKLFYITPYPMCQQMGKWADHIWNGESSETKVIWDMFGGIGTDSVELSKYFNVVTSEIDGFTFSLLKQNVSTFGLKNVSIMNINCLSLLNTIRPDLVYFDPPWGEHYKPKMKNFDFSQVYLDYPEQGDKLPKKVSCTDLVEYVYKYVCSKILIKAPLNSISYEKIFPENIVYILKCQHKNLKFIYVDSDIKYQLTKID